MYTNHVAVRYKTWNMRANLHPSILEDAHTTVNTTIILQKDMTVCDAYIVMHSPTKSAYKSVRV